MPSWIRTVVVFGGWLVALLACIAVLEVAQRIVNVGSFEGLLLLGGMNFVQVLEQRGPAALQIIHQLKELERLPGCSLARPYRPFLTK